jgi:hypothetical protein
MTDNYDSTVANFFAGLLMLPITLLVRAFVLRKLWTWFIVPGLHAPVIEIPVAIGISLIVTLLVLHPGIKQDEKYAATPFYMKSLASVLTALFGLGLAWLVHLFL